MSLNHEEKNSIWEDKKGDWLSSQMWHGKSNCIDIVGLRAEYDASEFTTALDASQYLELAQSIQEASELYEPINFIPLKHNLTSQLSEIEHIADSYATNKRFTSYFTWQIVNILANCELEAFYSRCNIRNSVSLSSLLGIKMFSGNSKKESALIAELIKAKQALDSKLISIPSAISTLESVGKGVGFINPKIYAILSLHKSKLGDVITCGEFRSPSELKVHL